MRAAAQLAGEALDVDDAHLGAVLLTEERSGAAGTGLVDAHDAGGHGQGGHDFLVGDTLDLGKLGGAHSLEVREVEAQARRLHERAGLVDMGAEHLAQGGVQDVRGGVVAGDAGAGHRVDGGGALVAGIDGAAEHLAVMDGEDLLGIGGAQDLKLEAVGLDEAGVAALAALLSVEGSALKQDVDLVAGACALDALLVSDEGAHDGLAGVLGVAHELVRLELVGKSHPHGVELAPHDVLHLRAGALTLRVHLDLEALEVDGVAGGLGDLDGEVDREAVGVMQLEGDGAGHLGAGLEVGKDLVEVGLAGAQRRGEALLLGLDDTVDELGVLHDLGVGGTHRGDDLVDVVGHEGALDAEHARMVDGAAQQAAKDVAATLVGGQDAVANHERDGAGVVGKDAQAHVRLGVLAVLLAGEALAQLDETVHEVAVVVGRLALHDGRDALKTHARVDVAMRQLGHGAVLLAVVLGEHQVPELQVTVAVAARRAVGAAAADLGTLVVVDLRARAARTGGASGPEVVVLAQAGDVLLGHAEAPPDVMGVVIVGEDGEVELVERQAQVLGRGDELEGPLAGLALGVAAEAEVAQHLEEGEVAAVLADVVDVIGAQALLARAGADLSHGLLAKVVLLELVHACVGKQQRRVVGDERRRLDAAAALLFEEGQEELANLGGLQGKLLCLHGSGVWPTNQRLTYLTPKGRYLCACVQASCAKALKPAPDSCPCAPQSGTE